MITLYKWHRNGAQHCNRKALLRLRIAESTKPCSTVEHRKRYLSSICNYGALLKGCVTSWSRNAFIGSLGLSILSKLW